MMCTFYPFRVTRHLEFEVVQFYQSDFHRGGFISTSPAPKLLQAPPLQLPWRQVAVGIGVAMRAPVSQAGLVEAEWWAGGNVKVSVLPVVISGGVFG